MLLLNRVLTVRPGAPASHRRKGWEQVTQCAIEALVERGGPLVAVLWGATVLGNTGSFIRDVASAWLVTDLSGAPAAVALVQAAATLPIFLLAIPAVLISGLYQAYDELSGGDGAGVGVSWGPTILATVLAFGVGLLLLARGWFRGEGWPKTPTVLWNVLLLPVAWSLRDSAQVLLALAVGLVALACAAAAILLL